jgi:hypothetical protein
MARPKKAKKAKLPTMPRSYKRMIAEEVAKKRMRSLGRKKQA